MKGILIVSIALLPQTFGAVATPAADAPAPTQCARPPAVAVALAPTFPDLPWKARIGADQWVQVDISAGGDVVEATMEPEKNPSLGFGDAAARAARRWKFAAAPECASRKARLLFRFVMPVTKPVEVGVQFRPPYEIDVSVEALSVNLEHND